MVYLCMCPGTPGYEVLKLYPTYPVLHMSHILAYFNGAKTLGNAEEERISVSLSYFSVMSMQG